MPDLGRIARQRPLAFVAGDSDGYSLGYSACLHCDLRAAISLELTALWWVLKRRLLAPGPLRV